MRFYSTLKLRNLLRTRGNRYKLSHMKKTMLRFKNKLPEAITCSKETINAAKEALNNIMK